MAVLRKIKAHEGSAFTSRKDVQSVIPRTADEFFALPDELQTDYEDMVGVITRMRSDRLSLKKASKQEGVDPRLIVPFGRKTRVLRRRSNGSYAVSHRDSLLRVLNVFTPTGKRQVAVRDSRQASLIGKHSAAVQRYLQTGDSSGLAGFRRKRIKNASGEPISLATDISVLDRLGSAGELSYESLYARTA